MDRREDIITDRGLGLLTVSGLLLVTGAIWWMKGLAMAALVLGIVLLAVAYCSVRADT
jgi:hypothetical protein